MEVWKYNVLILACLTLLVGCRASGRNPHLEAELRMQEDRIYQLQDCLQETQANLEALHQENESLRRSLADAEIDSPRATANPRADDRRRDSRGGDETNDVPYKLDIEYGSENTFQDRPPRDLLRGGATPPSDDSPSPRTRAPSPLEELDIPAEIQGPSLEPRSEDRPDRPSSSTAEPINGPRMSMSLRSEEVTGLQVAELYRERIAEASGEEGIAMVVTPRDKEDMPLPAAGDLAVVVIDPSIPNEQGRIARWDFARWEAASLCEIADDRAGFRLRLRWPDGRPDGRDLHLFVRYTTADGRQLQTDMPFRLERLALGRPPAQQGWQRKEEAVRQEEFVSRRVDDWSERSTPRASESDAPSWNGKPAEPLTVERGENATEPPREPTRVESRDADRVQRPVWSPDRE